ncbi:hypothetical protein [Leifsonia sp. AG29]|uniref:hypothetical protein n=1 Tax=Leifsonia sp. AG29 TaxID=2598860 RepID=UPI00131C16BF|nr:hypothetical protein [Leifsonia sp. AG29]
MKDIAERFLQGELAAGIGIIVAGAVVVIAAVVAIIVGARRRRRLLIGIGSSVVLFGLLALFGGISYIGTIQNLLATVPAAFESDQAAAASAEFARMRPGVDRLYVLMGFVWVPLILVGVILFVVFRRRRPLLAGIAAGVALGSVLTLSIDVLGSTRSEPYIAELVGASR